MLKDSIVSRIYECTNKECQGQFVIQQKANDKFKKKCPFCKKMSLVIESATTVFSFIQSLNKPRTLGALAEKNSKDRPDKIKKDPKPWWRESDRIDMKILKNPKYYVETGNK